MEFPFPVLLCDIGGTNTRFAFAPRPGAPIEPGPRLLTQDYPGFEEALAAALTGVQARPRSLIACAAGPVSGRSVKLTNAGWAIEGDSVAAAAGLEQGLLLNDFEAQAYSLAVLDPGSAKPIGETFEPQPGTCLVLGPGTGLGVGAILSINGRYHALASEAGHMDFGPAEPCDYALWKRIDPGPFGRISAETVLSGPGLIRLHLARCALAGEPPAVANEIALIGKAVQEPNGAEAATLRFFWHLVARFAGDLALAFLAKGGVTFSGGILPRITSFCDPASFRASFENKPPYRTLLKAIGTRLIVSEESVLCGMAAIAASPQSYAIDYAGRAWR